LKIPVVVIWGPKGQPTWPHPYLDCEASGKEFVTKLASAFPDVEFVMELAKTDADGERILKKYPEVSGFVVYLATHRSWGLDTLAQAGARLVLVDQMYAGSGGLLCFGAAARNRGDKVIAVGSSNFEDVTRAVNVLVALGKMAESKILVYRDGDLSDYARLLKEGWGTSLVGSTAAELNAAYDKVADESAQELANRWIAEAEAVVEPTEEDIFKAAKLYFAMSAEMERYGADAVTIDCLTYIYGQKLTAYPCLGFMELNSTGSIGVCEADLSSTMSFLFLKHLIGRPGYVSDPVIDEGANQIIYAHCVATIKPYGPSGLQVPYTIRSHAEDDKGASVQSFLPLGQMVTTLEISVEHKGITVHTGKSVANVVEPKACRTKLACEVNTERILENWNIAPGFGWHRVTCYGDLRREVKYLAKLQGYRLVEEDK